jgi:hypothetical protein
VLEDVRQGIGFGQTDFTGGVAAPAFFGHYASSDKRNPLDLEAVLAGIDW